MNIYLSLDIESSYTIIRSTRQWTVTIIERHRVDWTSDRRLFNGHHRSMSSVNEKEPTHVGSDLKSHRARNERRSQRRPTSIILALLPLHVISRSMGNHLFLTWTIAHMCIRAHPVTFINRINLPFPFFVTCSDDVQSTSLQAQQGDDRQRRTRRVE